MCLNGSFGQQVIEVACRALGFNEFDRTDLSPTSIPPVLTITETESILVNDVFLCSGNESHLSECRQSDISECIDIPVRVECLG